jgi:PST family polysaccharide transporter
LAPLAFYPLLTWTLGAEKFAAFAIGLAAAMMSGQLVEFGYGLSSVRRLSERPDDGEEQSRIFGDVIVGRLLLCIVVTTGLACIAAAIGSDRGADPALIAAIAILGAGYGFTASWYYIGRERAGVLAAQEIGVSFAQLALLVAFVRPTSDPALALALLALPIWLALLYGHGAALREHGVRWPGPTRIRDQLAESFRFFCFTGLTSILNRAGLIILGAMAPAAQVAYYAIGERIVTAVANATIPISRVIMPQICRLLESDAARARGVFQRTFWTVCGLALLGAVTGVALAPHAIALVFGPEMQPAFAVVAVQLCVIPLVLCNRMIGTLALVPLHQEKAYQRIVLAFGALGLVAAPLAILAQEAIGLAISRIIIEGMIALCCANVLIKSEERWGGGIARPA